MRFCGGGYPVGATFLDALVAMLLAAPRAVLPMGAPCYRSAVTMSAEPVHSRRAALALLTLLPPLPAFAARPGCKTSSNPSLTVVTCNDFGIQASGRLVGCDADEACVATGAVSNPSKFSPPWVYAARHPLLGTRTLGVSE